MQVLCKITLKPLDLGRAIIVYKKYRENVNQFSLYFCKFYVKFKIRHLVRNPLN